MGCWGEERNKRGHVDEKPSSMPSFFISSTRDFLPIRARRKTRFSLSSASFLSHQHCRDGGWFFRRCHFSLPTSDKSCSIKFATHVSQLVNPMVLRVNSSVNLNISRFYRLKREIFIVGLSHGTFRNRTTMDVTQKWRNGWKMFSLSLIRFYIEICSTSCDSHKFTLARLRFVFSDVFGFLSHARNLGK